MEHVLSVHPTGKFPEKVESLKRWARFPGWNFRTEFCALFTRFSVPVPGPWSAPQRTRVFNQMEQLFSNWKFFFFPTEISGFFSLMESALDLIDLLPTNHIIAFK